MASETGAVASGADYDATATRRRNVPSNTTNGGIVDRVEIDEKKTKVKAVSHFHSLNSLSRLTRSSSQTSRAYCSS